jgi:hypothetical protein
MNHFWLNLYANTRALFKCTRTLYDSEREKKRNGSGSHHSYLALKRRKKMVFCGQCGYQLAPGDKTCPRCGAKADVDLIEHDPGTYNPTELSQAIIERAPTQSVMPPNRANPLPDQSQAGPAGPLILGPGTPNSQMANDPTTMMGAQSYAPQAAYPGYGAPGYPAYPQQSYGYNQAGYQPYQAGQSAAVAQLLESSRRGKVASLLLILFGILLLIAAIVIFLLNQQGMIFA